MADYKINNEGLIYILVKNTDNYYPTKLSIYQYNFETKKSILIYEKSVNLGSFVKTWNLPLNDLSIFDFWITYNHSLKTRDIDFFNILICRINYTIFKK